MLLIIWISKLIALDVNNFLGQKTGYFSSIFLTNCFGFFQFVLMIVFIFRTPEQCPSVVSLLAESYNPHVRYGAAMALGVACAGTGLKVCLIFILFIVYLPSYSLFLLFFFLRQLLIYIFLFYRVSFD